MRIVPCRSGDEPRRRGRRGALAAAVLVTIQAASGCGQKGPLVLPDTAAEPDSAPAVQQDEQQDENSEQPDEGRGENRG